MILSHCWGDIKPPKCHLDASCPNQWVLPPLSQLPQTFQDAIHVTRAFDIRYLWIDSLCILQDAQHQADWEVESNKMAQYFRNAAFTIAASAARSGSEGLFRQRESMDTFTSPLGNFNFKTNGEGKTIYVHLADFTRENQYQKDTGDLDSSLLSGRGWVLQEELLSPGSLEFGSTCLHWRCFCAKWSEWNLGAESDEQKADNDMELRGFHAISISPYLSRRNTRYDQWYRILDVLNKRNMSYQADVLPAISGIAVIFARHLESNDEYLAGLWRKDLSIGLLWCAGSHHSARPSPGLSVRNFDQNGFFAPSWSWVSLAHKRILVGLHDLLLESPGKTLNTGQCTTKYISSNVSVKDDSAPYGRVTRGILTFSAQCPRVTVLLKSSAETIHNEVWKLEFPPRPKSCRLDHKNMEVLSQISTIWRASLPTGDCVLDDEQALDFYEFDRENEGRISAIFLPLLTHGHDHHGADRVMGLVLVPASAAKHQSTRLTSYVKTLSGPFKRRQDSIDAASTDHTAFYRRIGRGALNVECFVWKTNGLPFEEIRIV